MPKILLVEDEAPIRDMVRFALSRAGMEMLEAEDVATARQCLRHQLPDLILLDWMLPEESGLVFLRELRKTPAWKHIPVIMLTAMAAEAHKVQGLEHGADDYITKPFSPLEFIARIRALLRRAQDADLEGILSVGGLRLDPNGHDVYCHEQAIALRPTEYRLLAFLLARKGRVFTREQLLDAVWPAGRWLEARTVDVSIRRLRKALAEAGCETCIQTVRGMGYRLVAAKEDSGA